MAKNDIRRLNHTAANTRGSVMVCQNAEGPIWAALTAIMAKGSTTNSERQSTVMPRLKPKPGNTLGVFNKRMGKIQRDF